MYKPVHPKDVAFEGSEGDKSVACKAHCDDKRAVDYEDDPLRTGRDWGVSVGGFVHSDGG